MTKPLTTFIVSAEMLSEIQAGPRPLNEWGDAVNGRGAIGHVKVFDSGRYCDIWEDGTTTMYDSDNSVLFYRLYLDRYRQPVGLNALSHILEQDEARYRKQSRQAESSESEPLVETPAAAGKLLTAAMAQLMEATIALWVSRDAVDTASPKAVELPEELHDAIHTLVAVLAEVGTIYPESVGWEESFKFFWTQSSETRRQLHAVRRHQDPNVHAVKVLVAEIIVPVPATTNHRWVVTPDDGVSPGWFEYKLPEVQATSSQPSTGTLLDHF